MKSVIINNVIDKHDQTLNVPYNLINDNVLSAYERIEFAEGFFFILVTNGTAVLSDANRNYNVSRNSFIVLTPSIHVVLSDMSCDFSLIILYVEPDYFDTLSVGELVYNQISQYTGNYQVPVFFLEDFQIICLRKTFNLFSEQIGKMHLYPDGAIRHLCSFMLLQIADFLYHKNRNTSVCIKRSTELFRKFKKLLMHNYREHHDIRFYAENLNVSTTYLSRIVKSITNRTVCFHISELLCADARKMLECTNLDVKEIADVLGFSDQSVFGKFFLRKTGVSPLKFRMRKVR